MKWVCSPKFYSPLANWPWLRISPHSSLYVIYCLIITAWQIQAVQIPVQIQPNKSPLRKRLLVLLLWEIGHLSSPSRSCLGRLIFIRGGWGLWGQSSPAFHHARMQWENGHVWTRKPVNLYWIPQSPELGEISVHYLSYSVYGIFCHSSANGVGHEGTIKTPFWLYMPFLSLFNPKL